MLKRVLKYICYRKWRDYIPLASGSVAKGYLRLKNIPVHSMNDCEKVETEVVMYCNQTKIFLQTRICNCVDCHGMSRDRYTSRELKWR